MFIHSLVTLALDGSGRVASRPAAKPKIKAQEIHLIGGWTFGEYKNLWPLQALEPPYFQPIVQSPHSPHSHHTDLTVTTLTAQSPHRPHRRHTDLSHHTQPTVTTLTPHSHPTHFTVTTLTPQSPHSPHTHHTHRTIPPPDEPPTAS